jgi:hypothetical protein
MQITTFGLDLAPTVFQVQVTHSGVMFFVRPALHHLLPRVDAR